MEYFVDLESCNKQATFLLQQDMRVRVSFLILSVLLLSYLFFFRIPIYTDYTQDVEFLEYVY